VVAAMGIAVLPGIAIDADLAAGRLVRLPCRETFEV
jgi:DNA-binding transcriptional LysR family regulator